MADFFTPEQIQRGIDVNKIMNNPVTKLANDLEKAKEEFEERKTAKGYYKMLINNIKEFENSLHGTETVAIKLASFGQSITLLIDEIDYYNPGTIIFYGTSEGERVRLIQHISQLNFLIIAVKAKDNVSRKRIGFKTED